MNVAAAVAGGKYTSSLIVEVEDGQIECWLYAIGYIECIERIKQCRVRWWQHE